MASVAVISNVDGSIQEVLMGDADDAGFVERFPGCALVQVPDGVAPNGNWTYDQTKGFSPPDPVGQVEF
jgi:hypothetical protein